MDRALFNRAWVALLSAFPNTDRVTSHTQEIYWQMLKEIPDELWLEGVQKCLAECQFFPTIRDLGVACLGEQKEGLVWKCDPWRSRQEYPERVPGETWFDRLRALIREREKPEVRVAEMPKPKLEEPKPAASEGAEILRKILWLVESLDMEKADREAQAAEERKNVLREQAKSLGVKPGRE